MEQVTIYGTSEKTDGKTFPIELDEYTGALQTIDVSHHHAHEGDSFFYIDSSVMGNAVTANFMVTTPNTDYLTNLIIELDSLYSVTASFFEATDKVGDVAGSVFNRNRNSATIARTVIHKGLAAGGTTDGNALYAITVGSATGSGKVGGTDRNSEEIVLKRNTKYILRILSNAASNQVNTKLIWYEHPQFYD